MKPCTGLLPVLMVVLLAGCAAQSSNESERRDAPPELVQRQLDLGIGYLRQGDYQRAKHNLNRALDIDPRNATVHATFGLVFQLEGEYELAEQYFSDAVRFDPESAQARNSFGAFLFSQRRFVEAIEQLKLASENRFYPNRPTVFENLGRAYLRINQIEDAEFAFTRATQLNPEQARSLLELAEIKFDQQQYTNSRNFYLRHTRVLPESSPRSSKALWLCIRLARIFKDQDEEASCAEVLEGIHPASDEYQLYRDSQ